MDSKKAVPVPVEKALKGLYSFLTLAKEDLLCGVVGSMSNQDGNSNTKYPLREKRVKLLEHLTIIRAVLTKFMQLDKAENAGEKEFIEMVKSAEVDINKNFTAAQNRWVDLLLDRVTTLLDATQHVNLEKLTELMADNETAGSSLEGKDVILLLGAAGSGKTTTLHYLAGTSFREVFKAGMNTFKPFDVGHPDAQNMKVSNGGKEVITRHLQVAELKLDGKPVVVCDSPSFGEHESTEELIANSLGMVRAIQRAKSVRPVLVLSRDEIGFHDTFNAYPQILTVLIRLLGTDSNVNLEPFRFIFTKYDSNNAHGLQEQLSKFLVADQSNGVRDKNNANQQALIRHLIKHATPDANVIIPTKGDPNAFLRKLMAAPAVENPGVYFVPNVPDVILTTLKRQLKFTLLDLRDALAKSDNAVAIHRMQQMSKLANLLPEAGLYARHGFKAFKEIINSMVEDNVSEDDEDVSIDNNVSADSTESWTSSESEQWSNVSSKLASQASSDFCLRKQLSIISEEADSVEMELGTSNGDVKIDSTSPTSCPSRELLALAEKCKQPSDVTSPVLSPCSSYSSALSSPVTLPASFEDLQEKRSQDGNMAKVQQPKFMQSPASSRRSQDNDKAGVQQPPSRQSPAPCLPSQGNKAQGQQPPSMQSPAPSISGQRSQDNMSRSSQRSQENVGHSSQRSQDNTGRPSKPSPENMGRSSQSSLENVGHSSQHSTDSMGRPSQRSSDNVGRSSQRSPGNMNQVQQLPFMQSPTPCLSVQHSQGNMVQVEQPHFMEAPVANRTIQISQDNMAQEHQTQFMQAPASSRSSQQPASMQPAGPATSGACQHANYARPQRTTSNDHMILQKSGPNGLSSSQPQTLVWNDSLFNQTQPQWVAPNNEPFQQPKQTQRQMPVSSNAHFLEPKQTQQQMPPSNDPHQQPNFLEAPRSHSSAFSQSPVNSAENLIEAQKLFGRENRVPVELPEEEKEYADHYCNMMKEMALKAIEEGDYVLAVQRMQEFMKLAKANPQIEFNQFQFKKCVELFLVFSVALQGRNYPKGLTYMKQLLAMSEAGDAEARKCADCGIKTAIQHITELRERVVRMTTELHEIEDPDKFDQKLEQLRREREMVEQSNMLLETCMRGSDEKGQAETVIACISYGFKVGRMSR